MVDFILSNNTNKNSAVFSLNGTNMDTSRMCFFGFFLKDIRYYNYRIILIIFYYYQSRFIYSSSREKKKYFFTISSNQTISMGIALKTITYPSHPSHHLDEIIMEQHYKFITYFAKNVESSSFFLLLNYYLQVVDDTYQLTLAQKSQLIYN